MKRYIISSLIALVMSTGSVMARTTLTDDQLREYAASMLMVGFKGNTADSSSDAARYLRDVKVGGIILFDVDLTGTAKLGSRNITSPEQLKALTDSLRAFAQGRKFFISVDQEGGRVARLKPDYGFHSVPSAQYLGELDNPDTTRHYARIIADDLSSMGINMNLGPLLDVNVNPECPPIGKFQRSYSADPAQVTKHAEITIEEQAAQGIVCAVKHFPGHGSSTNDSHYGLTDITATWSKTELEPYTQLIKSGKLQAVMTAHIFNRQLDKKQPGTLSKAMITNLLRKKMHFDGLVLSDDMYMKGIIDNYDIADAIVLAINAGVDMLVMGNNISTGYEADRPMQVVEIIVQAVKQGRISEKRLIESHRRIMNALGD